jgi:putative ABC transport system permease protein
MLARSPGFTVVAVVTLALGIGANTAIFSLVNAVLLRPLSFPQPQQLVKVWTHFTGIGLPNDQNWVSAPEFRDIDELNHSFSGLAAIGEGGFNISGQGMPERVQGLVVSPSFFSVLGVQPALGRVFLPEEGQPGKNNVVLLSHGLWERRFGSERDIVGKTLIVNNQAAVVVGVLPAGFDYPEHSDMWAPLAFAAADLRPDNRGNHGLEVLARIKPGLSLELTRGDLRGVAHTMIEQHRDYPYERFNFAVMLNPLLAETVGDVEKPLWIIMGAVGVVLLIACANLASLLLVRASSRQRETAIRLSLGAGPRRLVQQFLTESLLLAAIGGAAGLAVAPWVLRTLVRLTATTLPRVAGTAIDAWVLTFTTVLTLATGILFGLAPAIHTSHGVRSEALKEGGRTQTAGGSSQRLRGILVAGESALALVLLVAAGLLFRSLVRVLEVEPGFQAQGVLTMQVALPDQKYSKPEQVRAFYREALDRIRSLPGVEAAGAVSLLPLSGDSNSGTVTVDTHAVPPDQTTPEADWRVVTPGFFQTMRVRLIEGRFFDDGDTETSPAVAIVDESLAHTYWPNESAIGKRIRLGDGSKVAWKTIVGVVGHVRYRTLEARSRVTLYWPEAQQPSSGMGLVVRTASDPMSMTTTIQKVITSVDPDQPVYRIRTMSELMADSVARRRLAVSLLGVFACLALLLASLGIYGVVAYSVAQRQQEIGIRMALGAESRQVLEMVLKQGLTLSLGGIAAGYLAGLALTRLVASLLYGVGSTDLLTFLCAAGALGFAALLASYIPARRATKVDPIVALRYE